MHNPVVYFPNVPDINASLFNAPMFVSVYFCSLWSLIVPKYLITQGQSCILWSTQILKILIWVQRHLFRFRWFVQAYKVLLESFLSSPTFFFFMSWYTHIWPAWLMYFSKLFTTELTRAMENKAAHLGRSRWHLLSGWHWLANQCTLSIDVQAATDSFNYTVTQFTWVHHF